MIYENKVLRVMNSMLTVMVHDLQRQMGCEVHYRKDGVTILQDPHIN